MTVQERKERARIRRQKQVAKQKMALLLATVLLVVIGSIVFGSIFSAAKNQHPEAPRYKYYRSITIEHGDTLWSIANEYCDSDCSTKEYIAELKELNSLTSDTIHAGQHLLISYYDTELK